MKLNSLTAVLTSLALFSASVHANWVCNVTNKKEQQFTYSAPEESDAERIADMICKSNGIKKDHCDADCFDTGSNASRWHCSIVNNKHESWSFTMLNKNKAIKLAKLACKTHGINAKSCNPNCSIE